ncbi:MAG: hypothetical protein WB493_13425 [Anaeromyxobacteraceae bacterium]
MKHLLRASAPLLAVAILSSCTTTNLVQTWRDPNYRSRPVNRVFVIAVIPNDMYRVQFENAMAQALIAKGFQAATAASVFPPGQLDKEKVQQYVLDNQVDLVIVQRLNKQTTAEYVPPTVAYVPPAPYYGGWYGAYGYGYGAVYSPGYMTEETNVVADTNVYSVNPEALVWSGNSNTFNVQDGQSAAQSLASSLVADLIKAQILVK